MESHFQRDQAIFAEIECLLWLLLFKVPEMDLPAVFQMAHLFEVKAGHEGIGRSPFRADHHVVSRLIPEIIAELDIAHGVFPAADDLELLVELQIAAGGIALSVAKHGNDDVRAEAMHCVWCRQVGPGLDFGALDHLEQGRIAGIGTAIDDMQIGRAHTGHDQIFPLHARHRHGTTNRHSSPCGEAHRQCPALADVKSPGCRSNSPGRHRWCTDSPASECPCRCRWQSYRAAFREVPCIASAGEA